ncbi:hypothetical protein P608_18530 [Comamonas thiooxydans]|uniref:Uncharacterized protein n=1 Tax=Comamonas thiooxydans TaxID=363952 RepID=A0A0E3CEE5_9BURK|nr:hypothetical protein P608_18530 [Comamonas thiooxydans]KGH14383.1 hypothetical protein P607_22960 [Comamonas thiooxydans]
MGMKPVGSDTRYTKARLPIYFNLTEMHFITFTDFGHECGPIFNVSK